MVAKVSSLLKTVKNVEEEAGKGVRSLENTIDAIDAELEKYNSSDRSMTPVTLQLLMPPLKISYIAQRYERNLNMDSIIVILGSSLTLHCTDIMCSRASHWLQLRLWQLATLASKWMCQPVPTWAARP